MFPGLVFAYLSVFTRAAYTTLRDSNNRQLIIGSNTRTLFFYP